MDELVCWRVVAVWWLVEEGRVARLCVEDEQGLRFWSKQ